MKRTALKRGKPLQAKTPLKRTGRPRAKSRTASERERIYGPPGFVEFVHTLRCCVCGHVGDIHAHHHANGGMGRKADWGTIVPVCAAHHRMIHDVGASRVAKMAGVDWARVAGKVQELWAKWAAINAG